jgi:hypothetical protein
LRQVSLGLDSGSLNFGQFYGFKRFFCQKIGGFGPKILRLYAKYFHDIGFQEKRHFSRQKVAKIAEISDHNIDPTLRGNKNGRQNISRQNVTESWMMLGPKRVQSLKFLTTNFYLRPKLFHQIDPFRPRPYFSCMASLASMHRFCAGNFFATFVSVARVFCYIHNYCQVYKDFNEQTLTK